MSAELDELHAMPGLGAVMVWMAKKGIPLARAEIIQQDEFTLDFILPLDPAPSTVVFGIT